MLPILTVFIFLTVFGSITDLFWTFGARCTGINVAPFITTLGLVPFSIGQNGFPLILITIVFAFSFVAATGLF